MSHDLMRDPRLDKVRVADLRSYLLGRGWKRKPFPRSEVIRFEGPLDDERRPLVQFVPASERLKDFPLRVEEIVSTLSKIEDRPAGEILRDILTPNCDKLSVRLETAETRAGTVRLDFATQFIENLRNLLVFAACAELDPRRFFPRALKDAVHYANRCLLGGAPAGSFVVQVECPLDPPASPTQVEIGAVPWERRVLQGLMHGLDDVHRAADSGETAALLEPGQWGLNANVCDALLGMRPDTTEVALELTAAWSHSWPIPHDRVPQRVVFDARAFETVGSLGRALRDHGEAKPRQWRGRIVRLAAEHPARGNDGVLLATMRLEDFASPPHVELRLDPVHYRLAAEAHLAERTVIVTGVMERTGRKARLLEISDFRVI